MKYLLTTILSLALALGASAQRFAVVDGQRNFKVAIGERISTPIKIKNLSDESLQLVIRRIDEVIGTSQQSFFCLRGECYSSEVNQLPVFEKIEPGETSEQFESVLESGLAPGFSTVKYAIYDRHNPSDAIEYEITYTVEDEQERHLVYSSDAIKIHEVYPNPVSEYAIIAYNLIDEDAEAKIVIHNVLGSIVGEYQLTYLETRLKVKTEDFNPGVYFYTLYLDNDGMMTRKLIVRK